MTTPQQFLESFFREKVAVNSEANVHLAPVYAKYFGEPLSKHIRHFLLFDSVSTVFDDVKESAGSAIIITSELWVSCAFRRRYHLAVVGEDWKITRIDGECLFCRGTGQSGQLACQHCDGEGWYDTRKNAA
jgi:hypothetical protein